MDDETNKCVTKIEKASTRALSLLYKVVACVSYTLFHSNLALDFFLKYYNMM
jgi:hypothetical protein